MPVIAFAWTGCGDDEPDGAAGPTYVDPGGTHGAEITLTVKGRGRVTSDVPGLDCPSDCFAKHVFASATADGAAGKITLKATPTPGSRFSGWSFSTEPVGSRGRGPANCNPVLRPGSDPGGDKNAAEIELPYGETTGTPPAGQEGPCSTFTKVPVVYNVTATFATDPPTILDAGDDGGTGEVVYSSPQTGALSRDLGMTSNGRLFWHFQAGGQSYVAYGTSPSSSVVPQAPSLLATTPDSNITLFEVDPYGVVYQTSLGTIYVVRYTTSIPTVIPGTSPTCSALAMDSSYNVYCRTTSSIIMWQYSTYTTPITLYTGVPSGTDLVVESASGPIYFSGNGSILSLPITDADGGIASPTTLIGSRVSPRGLEANSSYFWWFESTTAFYTSSSKSGTPTALNTFLPSASGYQFSAGDPFDTNTFWVASSTSIYQAMNNGVSASSTLFRGDLQNIGGIAVDSQYVYWSQLNDGVIRRASRSVF